MKAETKKTGDFQKTQISDWNSRKQQERSDLIAPPEVFYTDKELAELRAEAELRQREVKGYYVDNAKTQLNQHSTRKAKESDIKAKSLEEERAIHARMRELAEQERDYNRRTRADRNQEMNSTITDINKQKRQAWEAKKNDQTNKIQTEKLQQEITELTRTSLDENLRMKQSYNQDLSHLTALQREKLSNDFRQSREEEAKAKGFVFECYERDPLMKEVAKETGGYLRHQKDYDSIRKQNEVQDLKAPPPSLVTTEHLKALQAEALNNDIERRISLKGIMKSQYKETIAEREARIAAQKEHDAAVAASVAARNSQITQIEKQIKDETKKNYAHYLDLQLINESLKRQEQEEYRRNDPNTEKIVEENARLAERIVKCINCDGTLSHEKTYVDHRNTHL